MFEMAGEEADEGESNGHHLSAHTTKGGNESMQIFDHSGDGRDHNNRGYTMWMAGGGVKGGMTHGKTDEYGYAAVEGKVHIHDWHATILHLLGIDHERLTFHHSGRDYRLTDVFGKVVKDVIA